MKTVSIDLFDINELSPEAKKVALDNARKAEWNDVETILIIESFEGVLNVLGLPFDNLRFNLSYSQGDGVDFYGSVDIDRIASINFDKYETEWPTLFNEFKTKMKQLQLDINDLKKDNIDASFSIEGQNSYYHHYNSMSIDITPGEITNEDKEFKVADSLEDLCRSVSKYLEKMGYDAIEWADKDETIIETLQSNDVLFTADGSIWSH